MDIPVSADIEAGFGETPAEVHETVLQTIQAGAVGINLEDGAEDQDPPLIDTNAHTEKIRAAREAANEMDVPIVINARTDVFWREVGDEANRLQRAVQRVNEYYRAGSDCLFIPGVSDPRVIEALVAQVNGPINVLGGPGNPSIPELGDLGVARVSVGSGPMRATLGYLQEICDELTQTGTYSSMSNAIPYSGTCHRIVPTLQSKFLLL